MYAVRVFIDLSVTDSKVNLTLLKAKQEEKKVKTHGP